MGETTAWQILPEYFSGFILALGKSKRKYYRCQDISQKLQNCLLHHLAFTEQVHLPVHRFFIWGTFQK